MAKPESPALGIKIEPIGPDDEAAWRPLWDQYCAFYQADVDIAVTSTLWARLMDPDFAIKALVARGAEGRILGFCHYVLHPNTWGTSPVCYLEDLFTDPASRGQGVGRALIDQLVALGRARGWGRVYWHTQETNATARRLYDSVAGGADGFVRYVIRL
ncbi:acetyltransferase (GNAT) family protein [Nitrospirillum bahiense]|uniref:Acetyltransferase (GNAT) family protein n=1 Tax=Nitrospirillum amazonense TaxID=28077 RepID=A0A560FQM1_9PROT|nr:acetyltransferase (GNAT) family protein [Nitrospirillum amazonense]